MVKRVLNFRSGVDGVKVDEMAMVGSGGLAGVVDEGGYWRTAGPGGEFPTAELVSNGAVITVAAPPPRP